MIYVTVYEKTRHMGFFMKIEFAVWMISSTIELPVFKFQTDCALRCGDTVLCNHTTPPIIKKLWSKGVAMHVYGISAYYA